MPTPTDPPEDETQLALQPNLSPAILAEKLQQQLVVVTSAIEASLEIRELTTDFKKRAATLSADAFKFTKPPEDDEEQAQIKRVRDDNAALRIEVTKQGEIWKGPLNAVRTRIIDMVKEGIAPITKAEGHLDGLINARQNRLARERQEREEAKAREDKRIADEQAAAQRAIEDAERQRQRAEQAAREAETLKGKAKAAAEAEAARLAAAAQVAEEEAMERSLAAESAPAPAAIIALSDLPTSKEYLDFELLGFTPAAKAASLIKLATAHPELFSTNIHDEKPRSYSITLKILDVTDLLNGKAGVPAPDSLPGLKIVKKLTRLR